MHDPSVNKVQKSRDSEKEVGAPQSLSILEYNAVNNASEIILKNGDIRSVQEQDVSQIAETDEIRELFRALSENVPKIGKWEAITDRNEFQEAWTRGLGGWGIEGGIFEEPAGDYFDAGNRELEEAKVNNS